MNLEPAASDIREETHGRTLTHLRWQGGRLQAGHTVKFARYEGRRLLDTGTRIEWEDVPGEMPAENAEHTDR